MSELYSHSGISIHQGDCRDILPTLGAFDLLLTDPFLGSGGCLIAAKEAGIEAVGIEIEERYCHVAAERLSQELLAI